MLTCIPTYPKLHTVFNRIGYHNWEGLTGTEQEEHRIAASLGDDGIALIMRNHGATVVGRSVQEAFVRMYYLNRCCQTQLDVLSTGRKVRLCPDDVLIHAADQIERFFPHGKYEWRALSRLVAGP
jgi:ribulose-5-phosphate 4-epimerase/fuculose-1-phosphate aldolase